MLSAGLKGPDSMEFLYLAIMVMALAIVYLWQNLTALKRRLANCIARDARQRQDEIKRLGRIVERLRLNDALFEPVNITLWTKVEELYGRPDLARFIMPIEAGGRYDLYWRRTDLHDDELIALWLEGIIECPKT